MTKSFDEVADALVAGPRVTAKPDAFMVATNLKQDQPTDLVVRARAAAEEAKALLQDSLEKARQNVEALGRTTLDPGHVRPGDSLSLLSDLLAAKSLTDALELQTAFARRRWETTAVQLNDAERPQPKAMGE